jgi:hypothetical protein
MSQAGDVVMAIVIITLLTRVDLLLVGFYHILKTLRLTD